MDKPVVPDHMSDVDGEWEPEKCRAPGSKLKGRTEAHIFNHIDSIHTSGHFAVSGVFGAFPSPGISIKGLGPLRLPISSDVAKMLITRFAQKACNETVASANVTEIQQCEIDSINVTFDNPIWLEFMRSIVQKVRQELGVYSDVKRVRIKLCKLHIRQQGSSSDAGTDARTDTGVFGTLLVNLPLGHKGGQTMITYGDCTETFTTAEASDFGLSYIAHYNDTHATHLPLLAGYQCTMVYHLSQNPDDSCLPTASTLDEKMKRTDQLFMIWHNKSIRHSFMAYPLNHSHCRLHDEPRRNFHRVRHIARYCRDSDMFCVMIADIKICGDKLKLQNIRDLNNVPITDVHLDWMVPKDVLVGRIDTCCRSNSYEGVLMVPKQDLTSFFTQIWAHKTPWQQWEAKRRLRSMLSHWLLGGTDFDFGCSVSQRELHYSFCEEVLRMEKGDEFVGMIAVRALRSKYSALFSKVVRSITERLPSQDWKEIGQHLNLENPPVHEQLIIEALTKGHVPADVYCSVCSLDEGLREQEAEHHEVIFRHGWLDTVMLQSLKLAKTISTLDADALVRMVTAGKDERSMRQLITYQNVRKTTMALVVGPVATSMAFKLCQCLDSHDGHRPQLLRLLQIVADAAISHFESPVRDGRVWHNRVMSYNEYDTACTLVSFYHHIDDPILRAKLLEKLRHDARVKCSHSFLEVFLRRIIESEAPIPDGCESFLFEIFSEAVKGTLDIRYMRPLLRREYPDRGVRPSFTHRGYGECDCVRELYQFLLQPGSVGSCTINCTNPTQPAWQSDGWLIFGAEPSEEEGVTSLFVEKKFSKFTKMYLDLMENLYWIHKLDKRKLRNALGDKYEDTLALWLTQV